MWVEVVLLDVEWCGNLSSFIKLLLVEHLLLVDIVNNISCSWVDEISSLISWISIFVHILAILVLLGNNISFFIPIKISDNVALVKPSGLS